MAYQEKQLQEISKKFQIYGEILHAETLKIGHINETYSATYDQGGTRVRYIHQKINKGVFKNPLAVMKNVARVTSHLRKKLEMQDSRDITRRSLILIPTRKGQSYFRSAEGEFWRTFVFIEGVETFEAVQSPQQALQAGRAFGEFQRLLVDLSGERLFEKFLGAAGSNLTRTFPRSSISPVSEWKSASSARSSVFPVAISTCPRHRTRAPSLSWRSAVMAM